MRFSNTFPFAIFISFTHFRRVTHLVCYKFHVLNRIWPSLKCIFLFTFVIFHPQVNAIYFLWYNFEIKNKKSFEIVITLIWKYLKEINDSQWYLGSCKILRATTIGSPVVAESTTTQHINCPCKHEISKTPSAADYLKLQERLVLRMPKDRKTQIS
jgi:hypothetical protein